MGYFNSSRAVICKHKGMAFEVVRQIVVIAPTNNVMRGESSELRDDELRLSVESLGQDDDSLVDLAAQLAWKRREDFELGRDASRPFQDFELFLVRDLEGNGRI